METPFSPALRVSFRKALNRPYHDFSTWFRPIAALLGWVLGAIVLVPGARAFAERTADPLAATRATVDAAIGILHETQTPLDQRRRALLALASHKLDLSRMAHGSLGSEWDSLTPAQQNTFVPLFSAFIEEAYLNKIQEYAKLKIELGSETFSDPDHARVNATVIQPGDDDIPIAFMLEREADGWMIYDVAVEDVSMVENYHAQFQRVIRSGGITRLMTIMRAKQDALAETLGAGPAAKGDGKY